MNFWLYVLCMYCILSAGDLSRHVTANHIGLLPISKPVRTIFFTLTAPAMFGVFALPIYGFFVMPWWQPIVGLLLAAILASLLTRRLLAAPIGSMYGQSSSLLVLRLSSCTQCSKVERPDNRTKLKAMVLVGQLRAPHSLMRDVWGWTTPWIVMATEGLGPGVRPGPGRRRDPDGGRRRRPDRPQPTDLGGAGCE